MYMYLNYNINYILEEIKLYACTIVDNLYTRLSITVVNARTRRNTYKLAIEFQPGNFETRI